MVGHSTLHDSLVVCVCINRGGFSSICRVTDGVGFAYNLSLSRHILRKEPNGTAYHIAHIFAF